MSGPVGEEDISTHESRKKEYLAFSETFDPIDLVRGCVLCPPGLDFTSMCSCDECVSKIEELHDFEKEIQSKKKLVTNYFTEEQAKEDLCFSHCQAAKWTKHMYELLHKNLKAVSEYSKVPKKSARLGDVYQNMIKMMIEYEFLDKSDVIPQDGDDDLFPYNVLNEIDKGIYYYGNTKAKDEVMTVLGELDKLERKHVLEKKTVEAEGEPLHQISRGFIESQIKLVESLPVEELLPKAKELLDEFCPRDKHPEMFNKARQFISETCAVMIGKRKAFCRKFYSSGSTGSNGHTLNGLSETLDLLIAKKNAFRIQWEKEYAPYYTPHDRSDPKRQRTEK